MKIGILTFHASHNYGSMLQAYALQKYLLKEGHDVKIINLRTSTQKHFYANPAEGNIKALLRSCTHLRTFLHNCIKWKLFESFLCKEYITTKEVAKLVSVENVIKEEAFDALITGGDQIWNMNATDFSIAYFAPFNIPGLKKISYSPSFGSEEYFVPNNYAPVIKDLLSHYDSISVRDKSASVFLSELLGKDIPAMTDPTMLLDKSKYEELAGGEPIIKGKYIFYYSPQPRSDRNKMALRLSQKYNLPVYTSNGNYDNFAGIKHYQKVGPKEFLNLIKFSEFTCGKSFHLLVFSLILEKKIISMTGDKDARMKGLLEDVNLSQLGCATDMDVSQINMPEIDWSYVRKVLIQYKQKGASYLSQALS